MNNDSNQNQGNNWSEREIGALWKQQSGKGTKYLSGHVKTTPDGQTEQVRVVVFANKDKKNVKAPDFRMYLSQQGEGGATETTTTASNSPTDVEDVLE